MKVVQFLNQFFGGVGGEEKAGVGVSVQNGPVGPGQALARMPGVTVVGTVIVGDNYIGENLDRAGEEVLAAIRDLKPEAVVAGPAFNAGRYGVACGHVCKLVQEKLGIPAVTGMHEENAGAEIYRRDVYIVRTGERATEMADALKKMAALAGKLQAQQPVGAAADEGYLPRGIRKNGLAEQPAGVRAVQMLLARLKGQPFQSELVLPPWNRITPAAPVAPKASKVALVSTGGVVPKGNPDRMPVGRAHGYFRYDITGVADFTPDTWDVHHAGYETSYGCADPDRILPLDVVRAMEKDGTIGQLHNEFFVTSGQGCMFQNAVNIGQGIAKDLIQREVTAVILTAT